MGWSLAPPGTLTSQGHASRGRLGNKPPAFIRDFTLNVANRAAASQYFALGSQSSLPHGTKEIDLQFDGCKGFAGCECAGKRHAHRSVSDIAKNSPMERPHGICMLSSGRQRDDGTAIRNFFCFKSY